MINKKSHPRRWLLSGYQDSNLGPPAPKAGALPDCATSRNLRRVSSRNWFLPIPSGCATGLRYIPKLMEGFQSKLVPPDSIGMRYRTALHPETCGGFPVETGSSRFHREALPYCATSRNTVGSLQHQFTVKKLLTATAYCPLKFAESEGFEPSVRVNPVRRFSKPLVSATHPTLPRVCQKRAQR